MTAAFVLGQNVDLGLEDLVGMNRTGLSQNLATLDLGTVNTTQQSADVIASLSIVQRLTEHLQAGDGGGQTVGLNADDLHCIANLSNATLNTTGSNSTTAGNGHDILDGHQEGLVLLTIGVGDIGIDSVHQLLDALVSGIIGIVGSLQSLQSGATNDRGVVAREVVLGQQLTDLHLDQIQQLLVVDHIALVHEDNDIGHADLTSQQDVLTGLGHGTIGSSNDQDSAVHLSSTSDHVLDVVSMARAVNVSIVTSVGLILNVSGVDRDTTSTLLRSLIDVGVVHELCVALQCQVLGDSSGQSGLAVVNVTDGADVNMRLRTVELCLFSHWNILP